MSETLNSVITWLGEHQLAAQFIDWLISPEGQKAIGDFKDKKGNQLFTPNAK